MSVLGIDTSTAASAACVVRADGEVFEVVPGVAELEAPPAHARDLLPRVAQAMELAGVDARELGPVSSLAALAAGIDAPMRLPLIDARRGELFAALHGPDGPVLEPFVAAPDEVVARVLETAANPLAAGDGSLRFCRLLEGAGVRVAEAGSTVHVVRALHVCRLAADVPPVPPEAVLPTYLRAPDARPAS